MATELRYESEMAWSAKMTPGTGQSSLLHSTSAEGYGDEARAVAAWDLH